ncbi:hypothetical protein CONLIGDRAFT_567977 [Coniochaeta ligniaria NRRL 30616]|uniref:Zn(2)-C6 fungal-type domain-containing protein n=1 Tax=Coniochaeta ligniaria NRRL 30616 TaxID=1408157 RepID=A0A1J7K5L1_9PEZI|nr:hypothetical protein CONLIGDRAFT_567977 [Coniochaeta ligniaria NRRL 30616]
MPPRRSHKKSRAGCRRCKTRKIKCDEVHPKCGNCSKHGVPCDFENPDVAHELQQTFGSAAAESPATTAATPFTPGPGYDFASPTVSYASPNVAAATPLYRQPPTAALSPTPPVSRMMELRLMHHYTAYTCKTFALTAPLTEDIWRVTVPKLAFGGAQHLADAVLAVAALHLRSKSPSDKELIRASHAYMAASIAEYSAALTKGIDETNAEALFLTSALIAFQSTATRTFMKDEITFNGMSNKTDEGSERASQLGVYAVPFSYFHSFQGVKAITAASWQYIRHSPVVIQIINSQVALQLDFSTSSRGFFGHLLDGLEEELSTMEARVKASEQALPQDTVHTTRQAYQHAVAVLNWAHKIPHKGAALAFPATVSRRFVELLEERRPRALAILACYFALLRSLDGVWWLHGMARREVLGVVSLFNSDYFGAEAYRRWWPHLEWAMRIALWEDRDSGQRRNGEGANGVADDNDAESICTSSIPPEVWGADWATEEQILALKTEGVDYVSHIEMLSQMSSPVQSLPPVPDGLVLGVEVPGLRG